MKYTKRKVDIVVISDVHLGTYGSRAKELLHYLKSIRPKTLVLNGDIVDIWQFSKTYWPKTHMKVIKHLMGWISKGVKTYYIPGNHDEMLRKFDGFKMGSFHILNKLVLTLDGNKKAWIFHGDVFDVTMQHSKWLARLGAIGYDTLIIINAAANFISEKLFKKGKISLSKKIKQSVKSAVKFINNFEDTSAEIGIMNQYDYVICGHIHHPEIRTINNQDRSIVYMNSGDWIENLTALEYVNGVWSLYEYHKDVFHSDITEDIGDLELSNAELFNNLLSEFKLIKA